MTREEKEKFFYESAKEFGIEVGNLFETLTDEELEKECEWFDYLWTK
jgi:hypothetical protein